MTRRRVAKAGLMCHPTWWRGLYAEEVEQLTDDLLSDGRSELRLAADLLHSLSAGRLTDISAITDRAFVRPDRRSLAR